MFTCSGWGLVPRTWSCSFQNVVARRGLTAVGCKRSQRLHSLKYLQSAVREPNPSSRSTACSTIYLVQHQFHSEISCSTSTEGSGLVVHFVAFAFEGQRATPHFVYYALPMKLQNLAYAREEAGSMLYAIGPAFLFLYKDLIQSHI
ncbi:MAG: hypothetical protein JWL80_672 [Parcubacteria group bacterium]|nr:hypothetical protein [Parcubacteria group bacterium]